MIQWLFISGYVLQNMLQVGFGKTFQNLSYFDQSVAYVIYWYSITESLYLFTPDGVRVRRSKTKRLLPGIESVANNWSKGYLAKARILSQEYPE